MGFYSTTLEPKTAPRKTPSCAQKTASREIFSSNKKFTYKIERNPLKVRQGKLGYTYKTASGRSSWPSRDPIGEMGGVNLYGFVGNDPVSRWDILGLNPIGYNDVKKKCYNKCFEKNLKKLNAALAKEQAKSDKWVQDVYNGNPCKGKTGDAKSACEAVWSVAKSPLAIANFVSTKGILTAGATAHSLANTCWYDCKCWTPLWMGGCCEDQQLKKRNLVNESDYSALVKANDNDIQVIRDAGWIGFIAKFRK